MAFQGKENIRNKSDQIDQMGEEEGRGEKGLDNLINTTIKFDNEEIFYNIIKK